MTTPLIYLCTAGVLFCIALFALVIRTNLLHRILALNVLGSSIFMFFIATAARHPQDIPDPVAHALVLTGIVVAVSATALGLNLARQIHKLTHTAQLPEDILS